MTEKDFLETFRELIQTDAEPDLSTRLEEIEEWDSMAIMAIIAWLDVEHGVKTDFSQLSAFKTVNDIARLVPGLS